jgi:anion-transporting  ArsA/GET3 family ATPase
LFAWLISHRPTILFSQNKPATSNQPVVLFSQNKSAPAISHQLNEQADEYIEQSNVSTKSLQRSNYVLNHHTFLSKDELNILQTTK